MATVNVHCMLSFSIRCLYEFANTILIKGSDSLHMLTSNSSRAKVGELVRNIDIKEAKFKYPEDRDKILADIKKYFVDYLPFNVMLKLLLLLHPLDYSVDLKSLVECGGNVANSSGSTWDLRPLDDWLQPSSTTSGKSSALLVHGGKGEGKTTISALLVAAAGGTQRYKTGGAGHAMQHGLPIHVSGPWSAWADHGL